MAYVRDRLDEFRKLQDEPNGTQPKNDKKTRDVKIDLKECEVIRGWIDSINEKTSKAENILRNPKLHHSKELQNELKDLFKNSESIILKVTEKLKVIRVDRHQMESEANAALKMKYLQYTSLQQHFRETVENHRDCIEKHRRNLKMLALKTHRTIHGDVHIEEEELERLIDSDQQQTFTNNCLTEIREAQLQLRDLEQRHQEFLIIENHLTEVRDLFIQVAILVEEQQENINRAEHHANLSSNAVEAAAIDLGKAKRKMKKTSKIKIIIIVTVAILLLLVILSIIFH